jgi:hypothetical protein
MPTHPIHLYLGEPAKYVRVPCGQRSSVAIRHTTQNVKDVTCALCSGLLHTGLMTERDALAAKVEKFRAEVRTRESLLTYARGRLERAEAALHQITTAAPQGDGDPRPLEGSDGGE